MKFRVDDGGDEWTKRVNNLLADRLEQEAEVERTTGATTTTASHSEGTLTPTDKQFKAGAPLNVHFETQERTQSRANPCAALLTPAVDSYARNYCYSVGSVVIVVYFSHLCDPITHELCSRR